MPKPKNFCKQGTSSLYNAWVRYQKSRTEDNPRLILINGQPGSGKTTLKLRLSKDLDLPVLGKDDIKEFLFDTWDVNDTKWPGLLGKVSSMMLHTAAQTFLQQGHPFVAESAFMYEFARYDWLKVIDATQADVLEIYCRVPSAVRRQRFDERIAAGNRHSGHIDATNSYSDAELEKRYAALNLGKIVYFDTTSFDDVAYNELLKRVQIFLKESDT